MAEKKLMHLPECTTYSIRDYVETASGVPRPDINESIRMEKCADGCPVLARSLRRAKQVAREQGWLTDQGFIWDEEANA